MLDRWVQHQNWYGEVDTQAGDHLGDLQAGDLEPETDYCWRVRTRDRSLAWSDWSTATPFRTTASVLGTNLLVNPGAEQGADGWTALVGALEVLADGECGGISPFAGDNYFAVGGVCEDHEFGEAAQTVVLDSHAAAIDAGDVTVRFGGMLSTWGGDDQPEIELVFLDVDGQERGRTGRHSSMISEWTLVSAHAAVPPSTRAIDFLLFGTRHAGDDNDSYFDDLHLFLSASGAFDACLDPPDYPFSDEEVDCEGDDDDDGDDDSSGDDDAFSSPADDDGSGCECGMADATTRARPIWLLVLLLLLRRRWTSAPAAP